MAGVWVVLKDVDKVLDIYLVFKTDCSKHLMCEEKGWRMLSGP